MGNLQLELLSLVKLDVTDEMNLKAALQVQRQQSKFNLFFFFLAVTFFTEVLQGHDKSELTFAAYLQLICLDAKHA